MHAIDQHALIDFEKFVLPGGKNQQICRLSALLRSLTPDRRHRLLPLLQMLRGGEDIPEWFAFKSVVKVLREEEMKK
jgi:hypothetical protein